jgi:amphi-Trp domain-containing protein
METDKIELKQIQKIAEVVIYLEGLIKGFKEGKIVVQKGEGFVSLVPAEQVTVMVEAKKKKDKEKFSLELSWHAANANLESVSIKTVEPVCKKESVCTKKSEVKEEKKPEAKPVENKAEKLIKEDAKISDKNKPAQKG